MSIVFKTKLLKTANKFYFIFISCSWHGCCVFHVTGHGPLMYIPFIYLALLLCVSKLQGMVPSFIILSESTGLTVSPYFRYLRNSQTDRGTQPFFMFY